MNLEQLQAAGGFIAEPKKVPVKWNDLEFDVYVKDISFADMERFAHGHSTTVATVSACVLIGENKEPMTVEQAANLKPGLAQALVDAVNKAYDSGN